MGRPKSYDQDQILKKVMLQFWRSGFAETSISDLETATALNRYSLYKGFGDKEVLFEKALDYYQAHNIAYLLAPLTSNPPSIDAINKYFQQLNGILKGQYGLYGCLIQNSQKEGISQNELVKEQGVKLWKKQYKLFSACLGDEYCQLPFDKEDAIQLLLAHSQAQVSLARAKASHALLDKQYQAIKSLLLTWKV